LLFLIAIQVFGIAQHSGLNDRLNIAKHQANQASIDKGVRLRQEKAAREAIWAAADVVKAAESVARLDTWKDENPRILFPLSELPALNIPVQFQDQALIFERYGKSFRIDDGAPSMNGSHLIGHEGSMGCYCYFSK